MNSFKISSEEEGKRLDNAIFDNLGDVTRSQIKKWIDSGCVRVNSGVKKASYRVKAGERIEIFPPEPKALETIAQKIELNVLYEDSDVIVMDKPAGMVVHPAAGNPDGTLVNALLHHCKDLSGIGGVMRPGIVHRLDKGTSGVIVAAKNDRAHLSLATQFKERRTKKIYYALVYGVPKSKRGRFEMKIGRHPKERKKMSTIARDGREAVTEWEVVETFGKYLALMRINLLTGRTHQIRVHFSANGMPIVGDELYGGKRVIKRLSEGGLTDIVKDVSRPLLHAASIEFTHPKSGKKMKVEAELPEDFQCVLGALREVRL